MISYIVTTSPVGNILIEANSSGICSVRFLGKNNPKPQITWVSEKIYNEYLKQMALEFKEYFEGRLKNFTVPLDYKGTAFQLRVWDELRKISYGETVSYAKIAERLGNPNAYRAVANANSMNRIPIIIPCHRVIYKNGSIGGYSGGKKIKKFLLEHEGKFK